MRMRRLAPLHASAPAAVASDVVSPAMHDRDPPYEGARLRALLKHRRVPGQLSWIGVRPEHVLVHPEPGELWLSEHGPRGGDEINRIRRGRNYGWPRITHGRDYDTGQPLGEGTTAADVEPSVHFWVPVSIAPAGMKMRGK